MSEFERLARDPTSRRAFLSRMSAAGLGAAAAALLGSPGVAQAKHRRRGVKRGTEGTAAAAFPGIPGNSNNIIVLNFALTLEILEADLYRQALNKAAGLPLSTPLRSPNQYRLAVTSGLGCLAATQAGFLYLKQFTFVEAAHRDFVRAAIQAAGGTPVNPNPGGYQFPSGLPANLAGILQQILPLEETGVRAYLGAVPYLTDLDTIQTASTIYSTEARHSAAVRLALGLETGPVSMPGDIEVVPKPPSEQTFEKYLEPATVITRAATYFA